MLLEEQLHLHATQQPDSGVGGLSEITGSWQISGVGVIREAGNKVGLEQGH